MIVCPLSCTSVCISRRLAKYGMQEFYQKSSARWGDSEDYEQELGFFIGGDPSEYWSNARC